MKQLDMLQVVSGPASAFSKTVTGRWVVGSTSSNYESAPATKLLATRCVACGRALVDANSVEAGMGPECRERHGYNQEADEETRQAVNKRVFALALWRGGVAGAPTLSEAAEHLIAIRACGFIRLASLLELRLCSVHIVELLAPGGDVLLKCPYSAALLRIARSLSLTWLPAEKRWRFPAAVKGRVFKALCSSFPGQLGVGPRGVFVLQPQP